MEARFKKLYREHVVPRFMTEFSCRSVMEVPRLVKITLNMGVGEAAGDKKIMESVCQDLAKISGQKAVITRARKASASFKIREGYPIGAMVTLRGTRMFEFFDRLVTIDLPRVLDFRGLSERSFDGHGNYNFGIKEHSIFPEIDYETVSATRGMNISITTTAKNNAQGKALLAAFKFPFRA